MSTEDREIHKVILCSMEKFGLMGIAIATVIAAATEVSHMVDRGEVNLADLLMMFIYLEVLAMIGHYFETQQLPIRFPLYIGIVALARYLILDMKSMSDERVMYVSISILILTVSVLALRYGHIRFPYKTGRKTFSKHSDSDKDNASEQ